MNHKRRPLLITACCLLALLLTSLAGCRESQSEVTLTKPEWNSLTYPLGMQAYYLAINSKQQAAQLALRIDAYQNGKAVQQRSGSVIMRFDALKPITMNCAIYFEKSTSDLSGTTVINFGDGTNTAAFKLDLPSMSDASRADFKFDQPIDPNGTTPLFAIVYGANSYGAQGSPETVIDYHKEGTVLVFSLVASQTIREFKAVTDHPEDSTPAPETLLQAK